MTTELTIRNERVDDLPVLVAQQRRMGISEILDRVIQPHGNRTGLGIGMLIRLRRTG